MERREFVTSAMAVAAAAATTLTGMEAWAAAPAAPSSTEFYQLRKYTLRSGPQTALTENYFAHALIPALNRMAITPVGAFRVDIGPETPTFYLLIPSTSVEALVTLDTKLTGDAEFVKAAAAFWAAPGAAPAFERVESSLLSAFAGWPKLTPPKNTKRIFQLRIYESPSYAGHVQKVKMFNDAEFAIFLRTGLTPVFFGDALIGSRLPSLTYMLTFEDIAQLNASWSAFIADPAWKELSSRPEYAGPETVSNITNLYLSPLDCSQV